MCEIFIKNPATTNKISFHIGQKKYTYLIKDHTLLTFGNDELVPKKIKDIICKYYLSPTGYILEDLYVTYLDGEHFKVFMDLITTPKHLRVKIPVDMSMEDLDKIIEKYTYNTIDEVAIEGIRNRFNELKQ